MSVLSNRWALLGCVTATVVLGACSSTPIATPQQAVPQVAPVQTAAVAAAATPKSATAAPVAQQSLPAYLDPANPLSKQRSVYFDFDQSTIKPEGQAMLEMHGKFLASHPKVAIRIEGNTDEQGGAEYNLALGQKRAQAVVRQLKVYGVGDAQMEAVSFGKEKPKAQGHDDAARAENRRADLAYPAN